MNSLATLGVPAGLAFVLLLVTASTSLGGDEVPPPEGGVTVRQLGEARIVEAVLPGRSLGTTAPSAGGVAVLIAAEEPEGTASLYRFDPAGDGSLAELAAGLPAGVDAIGHLDLEGDGRHEVLVGEPGKIYSLGPLDDPSTGRRPRLLLDAPDLDLNALLRRGVIRPDRALIPSARVGRLEIYRPGAGGSIELAGAVDLPVRARRERHGLRLSSPDVYLLDRPAGEPLIAIGPEAQGKRRLLTTLVDPAADDGEAAEAWSQLPANERIDQSWYLSVDGRPLLAVAALSADKMGIFERWKLRVFALRTDRTRAGSRPVLEITTTTRNWYDLGVHVADLDSDGRDDLIVIQPDGLGRKKLAVDAYRGQGNGGFFRTPRQSVLVAPEALWVFGPDVDGDRVPDLVIVDDDARLSVFRGLVSSKRLVVEKKPRWSFEAGQLGDVSHPKVTVRIGNGGDHETTVEVTRWRPLVADVDGDGRGEILHRAELGGRALLRIIDLQ